jgi:hypothetical protein
MHHFYLSSCRDKHPSHQCVLGVVTSSIHERCFHTSEIVALNFNKMNCELMLTYDTPALRQTGSRNLTGQKTLPTIWGTYMKLVTKYQISAINSC